MLVVSQCPDILSIFTNHVESTTRRKRFGQKSKCFASSNNYRNSLLCMEAILGILTRDSDSDDLVALEKEEETGSSVITSEI